MVILRVQYRGFCLNPDVRPLAPSVYANGDNQTFVSGQRLFWAAHGMLTKMPRIPILAGPTASGKTQLSLLLAQQFPLEIVSADAMMVYQGMDVGTAKPNRNELSRVPHHVLDVVPANSDFSVADWVVRAEDAIGAIIKRGQVPLVVGGTGFYIRSLMQGLPTVPPSDPARIAALEVELKAQGLDAMVARLEEASPEDAIRAERNPRRVLRALEVLGATGLAPSAFPRQTPRFEYDLVVLLPPRAELEGRIEARTTTMLQEGLIAETQALLPVFTRGGRRATSFQAIGYKQALDHVLGTINAAGERIEISLAETERRINLATRQYAKRQETWFRAETSARFCDSPSQAQTLLEETLRSWG